MQLDPKTRQELMAAGASAIAHNAPVDAARATNLAESISLDAKTLIDYGCGRATLALEIAALRPDLFVTGIDLNEAAIADACSNAEARGLADRTEFLVLDATHHTDLYDADICIGSTHALGGMEATLQHLRTHNRLGAVVADGVWQSPPNAENLERFGELPNGLDELVAMAESIGWIVTDSSMSTQTEWDEFETGWVAGVRAVGTPEAVAFADERWAEYQSYRGVLGFGWLHLEQPKL